MSTTLDKIKNMRKLTKKIMAGGGTKRIEKLLDAKSFMELDCFVTHRCTNFGMEQTDAPAESFVTG